jgi:hypothetical protein
VDAVGSASVILKNTEGSSQGVKGSF